MEHQDSKVRRTTTSSTAHPTGDPIRRSPPNNRWIRVKPRHRNQEFLAFLKQIERAYRDVVDDHGVPVELYLVMDNYAAHKHKNVREWLAANPRFRVHFTPTHASWMNLVEVWFGIVERQAIRRGVFKSVKDLNTKIRTFIDGWNDRSHPFVWTKTADEILKKANRPTTSNSRH